MGSCQGVENCRPISANPRYPLHTGERYHQDHSEDVVSSQADPEIGEGFVPQRVSYVFLPQGLWGLVHTSTPQAERRRRRRGRSRSRDGRKDALLDARRGLDVVGPVNQDLRLDDRHLRNGNSQPLRGHRRTRSWHHTTPKRPLLTFLREKVPRRTRPFSWQMRA